MAGRKLKVFQAQFGFFDTVVAAPSQAAALRAWGTHQNLFASGEARVATDAAAAAAALAHPETPLRRAVGSGDPYQLEPKSLPKVPDAPKPKSARPAAKAEPAAAAEPAPDRRRLDAAEAALRKLNEARKREEADFRRRQDALDKETAKAQSAYADCLEAAMAAVEAARQAYRQTGGRD